MLPAGVVMPHGHRKDRCRRPRLICTSSIGLAGTAGKASRKPPTGSPKRSASRPLAHRWRMPIAPARQGRPVPPMASNPIDRMFRLCSSRRHRNIWRTIMRPWPVVRDFFALSLFFAAVYGFAMSVTSRVDTGQVVTVPPVPVLATGRGSPRRSMATKVNSPSVTSTRSRDSWRRT